MMSTIDSDVRDSDVGGEYDVSDHGRIEAMNMVDTSLMI